MAESKKLNNKTVIAKPTSRDQANGRFPTTVTEFTVAELLQIVANGQLNIGSGGFRYNSSTDKLEFSHDGSLWQIIGSGGGGMGGGDTLFSAELGLPNVLPPNTILDTFNTDKGTKVGRLHQMQDKGQTLEKAEKGDDVALSIRGLEIGKDIQKDEILFVNVPESHVRQLWSKFLNELTSDQKEVLREYIQIMRQNVNAWWGM